MARRGRPVVCIDFILDQLRVIEVRDGEITGFFVRPLPAGSLRSGDPVEPQVIGIELQQSMRAVGMEGVDARLALPDEAAVGKIVELPRMPDRHLRKAVAYAAERELPFPVDRAAWSWEIVSRDETAIAVYLVAAWRDIVDRVAEVAVSAGLTPTVVEPRALAVARTFGLSRVTVIEAGESHLHLTQVLPSQAAFVESSICPTDQDEVELAIERLLQRSNRRQLGSNDLELSPVVLAGGLEDAGLRLSVPAAPLSTLLNGHPPHRPQGMESGNYLANIGLAMRN
jgi:Tfp pilus assembly PilM family ATPase